MTVAGSASTSDTAAARVGEIARTWIVRTTGAPLLGYPIRVCVLAAVYYGVARLGYQLGFAGPVAAIVWLPIGVAISVLCIGGLRYWPGVLLGDLLANNYSALPFGSALGQTCGNMLEALVGAYLICRLARKGSPLATVAGLAGIALAIAVATAISATIGAVSLLLGDVIKGGAFAEVWRTWWLGDTAGALVVVPLALAWYGTRLGRPTRQRWLEGALMVAAVCGASELAFETDTPLSYLVFPPLIWSALRFGQRGASLAILLTSGFVVWNTSHYAGPFHFHSITHSILSAQLFIVVAALSTLCLAALVLERERFAEQLGASRTRLLDATDAERRRLEQNLHDGAQQRLIALAIHLRLASEYVPQTSEQTGNLEAAENDLQLAIDELREIAHGTHPAVLTNLGLVKAIQSIATRSTLPVTFVELPSVRVDDRAEAVAYYVFAEALANAQKHARATSVRVRAIAGDSTLEIEISDDGVGGATESVGSGLIGLRDRVEAVGGTFELTSYPGTGTRVTAAIPRSAATAQP
jgi:signal transduction histidine kinase